jgi:methionyl-tRNA formyltransferase
VKIIFFGTPQFAAEVLRYLLDHKVEIVAVVTQPDRPKGRSLQLTPSPVKLLAQEKASHIPIFQPVKASQEPFLQDLTSLDADLYVVVAFGQILSQKLLDIPPLGCINVHTSLLPKYRGAAPIQRAIMAGETETGVSIQKMVRQLDAGDVIATAKTEIFPDATFGELEERLIHLSQPLLLDVLTAYEKRIPEAIPQDSNLVTYASKIELEEGEINWKRPSQEIHNLIRAFSPRPGAWCWLYSVDAKKRLKILRSKWVDRRGPPGEISLHEPIVTCGEGAIQLLEVQPEGKKVMKASDWLRGQKNISLYN